LPKKIINSSEKENKRKSSYWGKRAITKKSDSGTGGKTRIGEKRVPSLRKLFHELSPNSRRRHQVTEGIPPQKKIYFDTEIRAKGKT